VHAHQIKVLNIGGAPTSQDRSSSTKFIP